MAERMTTTQHRLAKRCELCSKWRTERCPNLNCNMSADGHCFKWEEKTIPKSVADSRVETKGDGIKS